MLKGNKTPPQRHFDQWATRYDRDLSTYAYTVPRFMFDYLAPYLPDSLSLLDIGIGTGLSAELFRRAQPEADITGVDISQNMLRICQSKGIADQLRRCNVESERLPFARDAFNLSICAGVLEYIKDPNLLFESVSATLQKNGIACFAFETPVTRPIYERRFLSQVTQTAEFVQITRLALNGFPRVYTRYLYTGDYVAAIAARHGLVCMERRHIPAYHPDQHESVTYDLLIFRKS